MLTTGNSLCFFKLSESLLSEWMYTQETWKLTQWHSRDSELALGAPKRVDRSQRMVRHLDWRRVPRLHAYNVLSSCEVGNYRKEARHVYPSLFWKSRWLVS